MKKQLLCILIVLSLLFSGCSLITGESNTNSPASIESQSSQMGDTSASAPAQSTDVSQIDLSKIQGKIKNLHYAGDSRLFVLTDELYLYDLNSGAVTAQTSKELGNDARYEVFGDGFAAVGNKISNSSSDESLGIMATDETAYNYYCIFYDKNLNKISELDFTKLLSQDEDIFSTESIAFSSDGSSIAYETLKGLYLYDVQSDKKITLVDLTADGSEHSGIQGFEQIGFTNGDKSIAFKAQSLDVPPVETEPSFDTFGVVNIDGSGLSNKTMDGYAAKELTVYESEALLAQDFKTASGQMMVMNTADGKTSIYDLKEKSEGGNIYGSDGGCYFASSTGTESGWTIRIYDTRTGKMVAEQSVSNDGEPLYGQRDPIMRVLDDAKTCIVLLGANQDSVNTKITTFAF